MLSEMDDEPEKISPPDSDTTFSDSLSDAEINFDASLRAKFTEPEYKKLRTIGAFIMRGLTLEEACILARVSKFKLDELMTSNEDVHTFIIFKQIAYKAGLLNTLSASAIQGRAAKSAGYLLEKKYPKEFDPKKGDPDAREPDVIERAIAYVRQNSETAPLVRYLPQGQ